MEDTFLQGGFLVVQSKGTVTLSPTWDALQRLEYNSYLLFWGLALSKISTFYSVIYESFHALWRLEKVVRSPRFRGWELGWEMGRQLLWGCLLRIYSDLESLSSPSSNSEFCPAACEAQKTSQVRAKLQPKPFGMGRPGLDRAAFQTLLSFSLSTLLSIFLKSKGIIMLCLSLLHPAPSPAAKGNGNEHPTCLSFQLVTRLGYCLCFPLRDTDKKLWYSHSPHIKY